MSRLLLTDFLSNNALASFILARIAVVKSLASVKKVDPVGKNFFTSAARALLPLQPAFEPQFTIPFVRVDAIRNKDEPQLVALTPSQ